MGVKLIMYCKAFFACYETMKITLIKNAMFDGIGILKASPGVSCTNDASENNEGKCQVVLFLEQTDGSR